MKKRKNIHIVLISVLVLIICTPVYAENRSSAETVQTNGQFSIMYTYLSAVGSSLSIENGYATCSGFINLFVDYDSTITITLQRSSNGGSWSDVKSWTQSFTGTGVHSIEKGYYVFSGYTYRVLTTAKIKNGASVLETGTCYSPEEEN